MTDSRRRRSGCAVSCALETLGDTWSLLIVRDMVYYGKKTFGEFLDSEERIASNILASRLLRLEQAGIVFKEPHAKDKRKAVYSLSDKGLDLIPILVDMALWSARHDPQVSAPQHWLASVKADREGIIELIRETVRRGG